MATVARDQVFISYSHQDKEWLDRLQIMLKPLVRKQTITVWADTRIDAGKLWHQEIQDALARAKVAVLLVTPDFLASDFIAEHELPPLLNAQSEGLTVVWIPVKASLYEETEITDYQAAHDPARPLEELSPGELNKALVDICKKIKKTANP